MTDYSKLPDHIQDGFRRYIEDRIEPGSFVRAVLENNLVRSFGKADHINQARMFEIAAWLYNEAPSNCWGSPEIVAAWLARKEK